MHIVYHCVGGTHSSVIAAAIHLGILPGDRIPAYREILRIPHFDSITSGQYGCIIHRGIDEHGNDVYTLSRRFSGGLIIRALRDLTVILTGDKNSVTFVNVSPLVNTAMKVGGFLSRQLNIITIGRPIVLWGSCKAYMGIARLVLHTKESVRRIPP